MKREECIDIVNKMIADGIITQGDAAKYFPELKESEDEKIRKYVIKVVHEWWNRCNDPSPDFPSEDKMLAYLEKQGEQKPTIEMKTPEESLGIDSDTYNKIVDECIYGEQKLADKVEPKFKVGDWVVTSYGKVNQIVSVDKDDDGYTLDDGTYFSGSWCDMFHLWTIQDAKDGDVLSYRNGQWILIFKKDRKEHEIAYHALISDKGFSVNDVAFTVLEDSVAPATKEQRDTLMKAMADAGYTFDFEKRELKKIEKKHAWSEEDGEIINNIGEYLNRYGNYIADKNEEKVAKIYKSADWLKSLKERYTWKPSDEQMKILNEVLNFAANHENPHWNAYIFGTLHNLIIQLKKLK